MPVLDDLDSAAIRALDWFIVVEADTVQPHVRQLRDPPAGVIVSKGRVGEGSRNSVQTCLWRLFLRNLDGVIGRNKDLVEGRRLRRSSLG